MSVRTTTIGAYPKPNCAPVPNWPEMGAKRRHAPTEVFDRTVDQDSEDFEALLDGATIEVVREQVELGIDVPTDGEVRREHYIYYQLRHMHGIDFNCLSRRAMRDGSWTALVPTFTGPISAGASFLARDWRIAQSSTWRPVKITLPGPMTIIDSTADSCGRDDRTLALELAGALNCEIRRLAESGCKWIQVDEPVFARNPNSALSFGIEALAKCFEGVDCRVNKVVHICCGYPSQLDQEECPKADATAYHRLAGALNSSPLDAVSIEDAHRKNDLALFRKFSRVTVILGLIDIACSKVEDVDSISSRLRAVLDNIDTERLMVAPDCGLVLLPRELVKEKLRTLVEAAQSV